jgi:hypothetical protein
MVCRHPYSKLHWITSNKAVIFEIAAGRDSSLSLAFTSYKFYTCSVHICAEEYIKLNNCQTKQWHNTHFILGNISKRGESQVFADPRPEENRGSEGAPKPTGHWQLCLVLSGLTLFFWQKAISRHIVASTLNIVEKTMVGYMRSWIKMYVDQKVSLNN